MQITASAPGRPLLHRMPARPQSGERFSLGCRPVPGCCFVPRLGDAASHVGPHDAGAQEAN